MSSAGELDISNAVVTAKAKRLAVVELEPLSLGAAATRRVNIAALSVIALVDRALETRDRPEALPVDIRPYGLAGNVTRTFSIGLPTS